MVKVQILMSLFKRPRLRDRTDMYSDLIIDYKNRIEDELSKSNLHSEEDYSIEVIKNNKGSIIKKPKDDC